MAGLPARLAVGLLTQRSWLRRRLGQPVRGRRLAGVARVGGQPRFQLGDPRQRPLQLGASNDQLITKRNDQRGPAVRIDNDPFTLAEQVASWGENPEVVLEATYGWYWAADVLAEAGAVVHLAHPLGVKGFAYRRVKNDERDAADLADLLRMGRLPQAWIAPPAVRGLREAVRHRCKLVAIRSGLKAQVHSVLAKQGVRVPVSDLFGVGGQQLLDRLRLDAAYAARVGSLRRLIDTFTFEIDVLATRTAADLRGHAGWRAIQAIDGV